MATKKPQASDNGGPGGNATVKYDGPTPPFTGFTPIAEARAVLLRLPHPDAHASSFMKGDLIERGHYASATVTGVYIVQGGYVVDLHLNDGSTVTLFSNAEFSADVTE